MADPAYRDLRNSPIMSNMGIEKGDTIEAKHIDYVWTVTSVNLSNGMASIEDESGNIERVPDAFFKSVEKKIPNYTFEGDNCQIERLDENENYNYRIVTGNPLTGEVDNETYANMLKINGFAVATGGMEIGEYNQKVIVEKRDKHATLANILLEKK